MLVTLEIIGNPGGMKLTTNKNWKNDTNTGDNGESLWKEWFDKFPQVYECFICKVTKFQIEKRSDGVILTPFRYITAIIEIKNRRFNYLIDYSNDGLILLEVSIIDGKITGGLLDSHADIYCYGFLSKDEKVLLNAMCFSMHEIQLFLKQHAHEYDIRHSRNSNTPFILVPYSTLVKYRIDYLVEKNL